MNGLLTFDLVGPMAHFRRFYTNSSSLSYAFPPRTTLMGILAAMRGLERDSYYAELALEHASIGVSLKTPLRRIAQTVNYVRTKSPSELDGSAGPTQVPVEFLLPANGNPYLRYRVFFTHQQTAWVEELYTLLEMRSYRFPLYMGITECPAWVENPRYYPSDEAQLSEAPADPTAVITVLPVERIRNEGLRLEPDQRLYKERIPLDFHSDRRLRQAADVLWEAHGRPITASIHGRIFSIDEGVGVFMEVNR